MFALFLIATSAAGATSQVSVLIDSDNNAATGCSVATLTGAFAGAEQVLTTTIDTQTNAVTSVTRQVCSGGVLGSSQAVDAGGWAVGTTGGLRLIETHVPWTALGATAPLHLGFTATESTLSAAVLQRPDTSMIFFAGVFPPGRHRTVNPAGGTNITLDGDGNDWAGIAPLAAGAASSGTSALRFINIYAASNANELFFRFDVQSNPTAPTANDDDYTVIGGGTVNVTPPGVLSNDHDPNSLPLSAVLISGPQHGTLNLNANGSFTYVNDGSPAVVDSFRYKATNGTADSNTALVTLTIISGTPPAITSANNTTFTVGSAGSFTVTKTGNPTPTLSLTGALPSGVTFNATTGVLSGTPAVGTGRTYNVTIKATNAVGTATQNFMLTVNETPSITSANAATFTTGAASSFTVTTLGFPLPTITETGALPAGITLTNGVLSGTPTASGVFPITLTATNSLGTATQNFTLTVNQPPSITSANSAIATVGIAFTFTVTATGFPTPTLSESGALPAGLTFNAASGVLSGTPAAGTGGTYSITFTATNSAAGANQAFTLTVDEAAAITSATSIDFVINTPSTFSVTTTGFPKPAITETGALPAGMLLFDNGNGTATISGSPTVAGSFPITISATNAVNTATQSFTIRVWAPPVGVADAYNATINTPLVVAAPGVLGNDTVNGATPAVTIAPTHGALVLNADGSFTYTPNADYIGPDAFTYTLTNFAGASSAAVSISVFAPPVAIGDAYQIAINTPRTIAAPGVLGNDNVNAATITGNTTPTNGAVTVNADGSFTYTPNAGFSGADSFTYTLTNPAGNSTATVSLTVVAAPVANADSYNAVINAPLAIAAPGVLGNDTVNGATISGNTTPSHGTVTLNADGSFTYTPGNDYAGPDSFDYTLTNVAGNSTATVSLTVFPPPIAGDDTYGAVVNTPLVVAAPGVLGNDIVNAATITGNTTPSHAGVVLNADGSFTYTPTPAYVGADSFTYTLTNPAGSSTATVNITVFQPPIAQADSYATATNTTLNVVAPGVLNNDLANGATITANTTPANGSLTLNADGSFSYTPNNAFAGSDAFTYTLGNAAGTSTATVTINVIPPPVAAADSYNAVINTALNVAAPGVLGNDTLNGSGISSHTNPTSGSLTLNPDGSFAYNPNASFTGIDSFTYTLTNLGGSSTATVTITVWAPPVAADDTYQAAKNTADTVPAPGVLVNDAVNGATVVSNTTPTNGTATVNADGSFTYTPNSGFTGSDTFQYTLSNFAGTSTATVHFTVVDPPLAVDDSYNASPAPLVIAAGSGLLFNDTVNGATVVSYGSPNGTEQTTVGTSTPTANGTVTVNADGSFTYQANSGFFSTDTFKYVITNAAGSSTATVTINVTCPTITVSGTVGNGIFGTAYSGSVTSTGGSGTVTYAVTSGTFPGGLTLASDGTISGTPNAVGSFTFTVTATDAGGCTGSQPFTVVIQPAVHDANYANAVGNTQAVTASYSNLPSLTTPVVTYANNALVQAGDASNAAMTVTAGTCNNGGSIVFDSNGEWLYTPAVGFTGTDSCGYTVTSNGVSAGANVNIALSTRVWYVNNSGSNGDGRSQSPFNSLSSFASAARVTPDASNDIIFVFNGTSAPYDGGVALLNSETLWGEGVALVVNGNTLVPAGTKPQITNTNPTSDAVLLGDGDTVKGVSLSATRDAIRGVSKAGFTGDTLFIQNAAIGLDFNPMTGAVNLTNTTINNNAIGVLINGGSPTVTMDSTNSIAASTSEAIAVQNLLAAGVVNIGAPISDNSGGIIIGGNASGSSITFSGTQTLNGSTGVSLTSDSGATITFSGTLNIVNTPAGAIGFGATGGGTLNVSGTANITGSANGTGLSLNGMTIGSSGVTFNSVGGTGMTTGISIVNTTATNPNPVVINGGTITNPTTGITMQGANTNLSLNGVTVTGATTALTNTTNFGTLGIGANVNLSGATAINLTTGTIVGSFNHVNSTGGTNGVSFTAITTSNAWGCTCSGDTLTGASGATFKATNLNAGGIMTWGSNINQANAADAVNISGSTGFITFSGHVTTSGASTGINISSSTGNYTFSDSTPNGSTIAGSGGGITIGSATTANVTFGSGYAISTIGTPFLVSGTPSAVTGNITYNGTITKSAAGRLVDVTSLNSPGSLNMSRATPAVGDLTLNNTGATGISVVNSSGNITIANASITFVSAGPAFTGSGNSGSINLAGLQATGTGSSPGLLISGGGTINITGSAANPVINVSGGSGRAIDGTTVSYTGALNVTNATISGNASADTITLTGTAFGGTGSTVTGSNRGLVMSGGSLANGGGLASLTSSGGANGISLTNVSGGLYTISAGSLTNNSGASFFISGGNRTITYNGTISQTNAQTAVSIGSSTGGTITLGGNITASTSTQPAINLTSNTGATISFSGNLGLTTTTGTAFNATGGGTVTATNANSTVSASGGIGVNIANTTIGAANVTFFSVNANGGSAGISIDNTGTSGGFIVTGTVASTTKDNSGGTIQGMSGADGSTAGHGIYLNATKNVSLKHMNIQNNQGDGIHGNAVNGLTLQYCNIGTTTGNGTSTAQLGNFHGEGDVQFVDLTTSALIDNNALSNAFYNTLGVFNNNNTSINRVVITNNTFGTQNAANGNDACVLQATDGTFNATFSNNTVSWADGDQFQLDMHGGVASDLVMASNQLNNTAGVNIISGGGGVTIGSGGASDHVTFTFNINNNTITGAAGAGFGLTTGSTGVAGKFQNFNGSITNNTFGNTGVADSGSTGASDVGIIDSGSQFVLTFTGNHLSQYNPSANGALAITVGDDTGNVANFVATVTGNTISNPGSNAVNVMQGIAINVGPSATDVSKACFTMFGNTLTGSGKNGGSELRVRQRASTHIGLLGNGSNYSGAANDTTAVVNFETSQNTVTNSTFVSATTNAPGGFQGTCP